MPLGMQDLIVIRTLRGGHDFSRAVRPPEFECAWSFARERSCAGFSPL